MRDLNRGPSILTIGYKSLSVAELSVSTLFNGQSSHKRGYSSCSQYVEFRLTLTNMFCLQESRYPTKNNHHHSHFQEKLMSALDSNGTQE